MTNQDQDLDQELMGFEAPSLVEQKRPIDPQQFAIALEQAITWLNQQAEMGGVYGDFEILVFGIDYTAPDGRMGWQHWIFSSATTDENLYKRLETARKESRALSNKIVLCIPTGMLAARNSDWDGV